MFRDIIIFGCGWFVGLATGVTLVCCVIDLSYKKHEDKAKGVIR